MRRGVRPWTLEALQHALGDSHAVASALIARCPARCFGVGEAELVRSLRRGGLPDSEWGALDLDGLVLASACLAGRPEALAALDGELLPPVARSLARRAAPDDVQEAMQALRARLLLGPAGAAPKLAQYTGRGPLGAFLRIAAANVLSNLRPSHPQAEATEALDTVPDGLDLEARLARADQQHHFRACFREAVLQLTPRERHLLRLSLLDGLSIDAIAPMYAAHRATVARWLTSARERLSASTRALLSTRLSLPPEEVDHLLASVQNGFELSLSRALRDSAGPTGF
jgi:RNA polymerase sigma-70 factor (ECF subfamily)